MAWYTLTSLDATLPLGDVVIRSLLGWTCSYFRRSIVFTEPGERYVR